MLEIHHLVKNFGPLVAVDDVSFTVARGEVLGFLGPNGAGKSTTMKMITGFLAPTAGTAIDLRRRHRRASRSRPSAQIGYLPEGAPAYPDMTPAEFPAASSPISAAFAAPRRSADRPRGRAGRISPRFCDQPIETLSKGFGAGSGWRRRCCTIPPVLILDEPTDGLDPNQKYEMRRHHRGDAPGKGDHHLDPSARRGRGGVQPRDHHRPRPHPRRRHARPSSRRARATTTRCGSIAAERRRGDPRRICSGCPPSPRSSRPRMARARRLADLPARRQPIVADVADLARARDWPVGGCCGSSAAGSTTCSARSPTTPISPAPLAERGLTRHAQHPHHLPPRARAAISRRRSPMCSSSSSWCWPGC